MYSIKQLTDYIIDQSQKNSVDEVLSEVNKFFEDRNLTHFWTSIDHELERRQTRVIDRGATRIINASNNKLDNQVLLHYQNHPTNQSNSAVSEKILNHPPNAKQNSDLIAGTLLEDTDRQLNLTARKQLQRLEQTLTN
jgi:hypothetical protein